jgi:hypothetical protein
MAPKATVSLDTLSVSVISKVILHLFEVNRRNQTYAKSLRFIVLRSMHKKSAAPQKPTLITLISQEFIIGVFNMPTVSSIVAMLADNQRKVRD